MIVDSKGRMFEDRRKNKNDRRKADEATKKDKRKEDRRKENNKIR